MNMKKMEMESTLRLNRTTFGICSFEMRRLENASSCILYWLTTYYFVLCDFVYGIFNSTHGNAELKFRRNCCPWFIILRYHYKLTDTRIASVVWKDWATCFSCENTIALVVEHAIRGWNAWLYGTGIRLVVSLLILPVFCHYLSVRLRPKGY